jgi:membrane protein
MNRQRAKKILFNVIVRMRKPYYQGVAAELAFFFLLSMVPLFIIIGELLGVFSLSLHVVEELVARYVSEKAADSLKGYLIYKPSGTFNVFFLGFAIWAASKAQYSMVRIANYTYTGLNIGRGFVRERFRAILTVLTTILLLVFSLAILIYGEALLSLAGLYAVKFLGLPFSFDRLWIALRWPLGIAVYILAVSFINYTLPSERLTYKKIIPGSILTSAGMLIASWFYSYYTANFSNYDVVYGSLGSVVGLLIWFYILGYVMVVGIVLNAAIEETK